MRVSFENNTLTVVTEVKKELVADRDINVRNEEGNTVYVVGFDTAGKGSLDNYGVIGNVTIDGCVAFVKVLSDETDLDTVKKMYGEALINAADYTAQAAVDAESKAAAVDALFS